MDKLSPQQSAPVTVWTFEKQENVLQSFRGEFSGSRECLKDIRALAELAAIKSSMNSSAVAEFEMAVDEICTNIVEHSYEKGGGGPLNLEIGLFSDHIECIVTDHAAIRFPVTSAPVLGLASFYEEERKRGLGLDIIRHCVDKVEHQWLSPQGNQTRLIKFFVGHAMLSTTSP